MVASTWADPASSTPCPDRARRLGVKVHAWRVNDPSAMCGLVNLGVDGIITDYPDRLATVPGR